MFRFGFGNHSDFFGGFHKESRARRGDIKFFILEVLAEKPSHGYEIIRNMEEKWGGLYKPSPGSVYPTLQMLEEAGHLSSQQIDDKKVYTVTDKGLELLNERRQQQPKCGPEIHQAMDIKTSVVKLMEAVKQAAKVGNTETVKHIIEILDKARKDVYKLLSEL